MSKKRGRPPDERSAYRQVAAFLAQEFAKGNWAVGQALPSRRKLASKLGATERVTRLALEHLYKEGRIKQTASGVFVVGVQGYSLSARRDLVAVVLAVHLCDLWDDPVSRSLLEGIQRGIGRLADPLLIVHEPAETLRKRVPPDLLTYSLRGILLLGPFSKDALKGYSKLGIPVLMVDRPSMTTGLRALCVDNESAAFEATKRLHQMGHRQMAFLRRVHLRQGDIDEDSKERGAGFRRACKELKISRPSGRIHNIYFRKYDADRKSILAVLAKKPSYTALLAADGEIAAQTIRVAAEQGLSIPRDLSIAAFQPTVAGPKISGPRIDFVAMGAAAANALDRPDANMRFPTQWWEGSTVV